MPEMPVSVQEELHRFHTHLKAMEENISVLQKDVTSSVQHLLECQAVLAGLGSKIKLLCLRVDEAVLGHGALEVCAAQLEKNGKLDIMRSNLLKHVTKDIPAQTPLTGSTANQVTPEGQRKRPRQHDEANASKRSKQPSELTAGTGGFHLGG
ncbi:hypothetical protein BDN72DRAFT_906290 [Pluteus cervinus]|uniref:Uncharacterized protein n=1 Tax=Pluteus cervinus TaxID=181527 RepID=A0ACD3A007_9AGAR|nr:hypothetical protein BDN72DRAFT_906290 [Pluteus cervinus]